MDVLAGQMGERGMQLIGGASGPSARGDRPWTVETAKNREALALLRRATQLDPMSPDAQYRLGRLYEQLALRAWNAGLSAEGKFIPDHVGRARASLEILDEGLHRYAGAVALSAPYAEAWGRMGWALGMRARIAPYDPSASAAGGKDADRAVSAMRQAIAMNPNNRYRYEMLAGYGFHRLEVDRPAAGLSDPVVTEGLQAQRQAIELDPGYLPVTLTRTLRYTTEPAVIEQALPAHPEDALFAARLLEDQELWPQAKALFQRAIALAPDDGKPLYYREYAQALTRRGEDREAAEILRMVLRFDPQNLELQLALAGSLLRQKLASEALQTYQTALDLATAMAKDAQPVPPPSVWASMKFPAHQSREEKTLAEIQRRFPKDQQATDPLARAMTGLAAFYQDQGRNDLAVPLLEKAIGRSPGDAAVVFALAKSYDAVGAWISAQDYYKKAIELDRGNLGYRLALAERYYANDLSNQAISMWRESVALRPSLVEIRLKLASAYLCLEQFPEAIREYERILQLDPNNAAAKAGIMRLRGRLSG